MKLSRPTTIIPVGYSRRSDEQKDRHQEDRSVTRQQKDIEALARDLGYGAIAKHYEEPDGTKGDEFVKRPGLHALLADAAQKTFNVLIVYEAERLARRTSKLLAIVEELQDYGVEVWSCAPKRKITPENAEDTLLLAVEGYRGESSKQQTKARVKAAFRQKAAQGRHTGGRPPFGYEVVAERDARGDRIAWSGRYAVNAEAAKVVALAYEEAKLGGAGHGVRAIARRLNDLGHTNFGRPFTPAAVEGILRSPIYRGVRMYGYHESKRQGDRSSVKVKSSKPPVEYQNESLRIVSDDLWRAVQQTLDANRANNRYLRNDKGQLLGRPTGEAFRLDAGYLLTGVVRCSVCGGALTGVKSQNAKGLVWRGYRCAKSIRGGRKACKNYRAISAKLLERIVVEALLMKLSASEVTQALDAELARVKAAEEAGQVEQRRARVKAELAELEQEKGRLLKLIASSDEVPSFILGRAKEVEGRQATLLDELNAIGKATAAAAKLTPADVEKAVEKADAIRRLLEAPQAQVRQALDRLKVRVIAEIEEWETTLLPGVDLDEGAEPAVAAFRTLRFWLAGTYRGLAVGSSIVGFDGERVARPSFSLMEDPAGKLPRPISGGSGNIGEQPQPCWYSGR
jgi:site-specific DNA recombinase